MGVETIFPRDGSDRMHPETSPTNIASDVSAMSLDKFRTISAMLVVSGGVCRGGTRP